MSSWRIVPEAVRTLLGEVAQQQEGLAGALSEEKFEAIGAALSWCPEVTGHVPAALNRILKTQEGNVKTVCSYVNAGIVGVGNATIAYDRAQEEMAGNFEREMFSSAASGDFSYFERHGYQGEE